MAKEAEPHTKPREDVSANRRVRKEYAPPRLQTLDIMSVLTKGGGNIQGGDNPFVNGS
ncbi:hypothetical protein [uncultured Thiohalocapsa sp.]|uniref:hypothetical protein n=1 Tax=uncultured Thiohalocapsa sp. TaxID=768990 RepID=UPI0025D18834|nr:hypothetical protein [uncultured Thiohalocapsa sp.]